MKTKNAFALILLSAILSVPFAGCKKVADYINDVPVKELGKCNIKKIVAPNNDWEEAYFTYNQWGNPVKAIMKRPNTGSPHYFYRYDNKQRLTMVMNCFKAEPVDGDNIYEFHNFSYNSDGSVTDTVFSYGFYKAGQPLPDRSYGYYTKRLEFDAKGRIIKRVEHGIDDQTTLYEYDERGNLAAIQLSEMWGGERVTGFVYDNHTNFMRTNKVWMFLSCDYSVNNKCTASTVSCSGLPTRFIIPEIVRLSFAAQFFGTRENPLEEHVKIDYMCDCGIRPAE